MSTWSGVVAERQRGREGLVGPYQQMACALARSAVPNGCSSGGAAKSVASLLLSAFLSTSGYVSTPVVHGSCRLSNHGRETAAAATGSLSLWKQVSRLMGSCQHQLLGEGDACAMKVVSSCMSSGPRQ